MADVLDNVAGWAQEVFLVDSFSADNTVDIALSRGVHVVQRKFGGFGDQWNYALDELPITAPWTMKLDPDERITPALKNAIEAAISQDKHDALYVQRRLWFLGEPLYVRQTLLRLWRTGSCRFSDVTVNEHPIVEGREVVLTGDLEHHDSPDLEHWTDKQDRYTMAEAAAAFRGDKLSATPRLSGTALERRMWLKAIYSRLPFRHHLMFIYCLIGQGAWRAGRAGITWARLRAQLYRTIEDKAAEMKRLGHAYEAPAPRTGAPHPDAVQSDVDAKGKR